MTPFADANVMEYGCDQPPETQAMPSQDSSSVTGPPLLPMIAAGDASAVDRFVERYGGLIWSLARKMMRSSHDAEDVVQEIFLELWKNAAAFQPERGSEIAFVSVITRRRLVDRIRKQTSTVQVTTLVDTSAMSTVEIGRDALEVADELAKVRRCLEQLTANAQNVLKMILQEGLTHQEVSSTLCLPLGSVKSFARRGLLSLRDCVKRPQPISLQEVQS